MQRTTPLKTVVNFPARIRHSKIKGQLPTDPLASARIAGLRYISETGPGIRRKRAGKGFAYIGPDGRTFRDKEHLARIRSLVIPPAWNDVWICPSSDGHLQAVGRDAKGRLQYRYHPLYRQIRDQTKYGRMVAFGNVLCRIRKRIEEDLALPGLPKNKVLAAVVKLLDSTLIRVGNVEYAKANESFGLTTMRDEHVEISGTRIKFQFRGKSGVEHEIELHDRRLARIVKQCQDIPGQELFQYIDADGSRAPIGSADVNDYLREITGEDFTAKDFRTWAGTVLTALELAECGPYDSQTECKKKIVAAIRSVARRLGNRPATCRNYYVHPAVLNAYNDGALLQFMTADLQQLKSSLPVELRDEELRVLGIIQHHLKKLSEASAA